MKKTVKQWIAMLLSSAMLISNSVCVFAANDINEHWAQSYINKWISSSYISGYPDGSFRPDNPISRAEFVALSNKAFKITATSDKSFNDVAPDYWAYGEIQKGVGSGYVSGIGNGNFSPGAMVTREEASVMIARLKGLSTNSSYATSYQDYSSIADWAKPYVGAVSGSGIMKGFPGGVFRPQASMTRAEAVVALDKALSASNTATPVVKPTAPVTPVTPVTPTTPIINPASNTTTKTGDVTLGRSDTTLKDQTIKGDLILSKDLSSSNIKLTNVTVEGNVLVNGGSTITLENCNFNKLTLDKTNVEIKADRSSKIKETIFKDDATLTGYGYKTVTIANNNVNNATIDAKVDSLELDTDAKLKLLSDADIDTLTATENADNTTISISRDGSVSNMILYDKVRITGKGSIDTMTVYVSGVKTEIDPDTVKTKDGASKPSYSSSSSSSSSSGSSHSYDDLTIASDEDDYDGRGRKYDDVKIKSDDVEVSDLIVMGDLYIDASVGVGTVTLDDIEVRGNTYVYGGGKNSIYFRNCELKGDIISDVSDRRGSGSRQKEPVALSFDKDTEVDGWIRVQYNTILKSASSSSLVTVPKVIVTGNLTEELSIGVNVSSLDLNKKVDIGLTNGVYIGTINVSTDAANSNIIFRSNKALIGTLNAHSNINVSGTGTINKINVDKNVTADIAPEVTVDDKATPPDGDGTADVTSVTLDRTTAKVEIGDSFQLTATVAPTDAKDKTLTWASDHTEIASVDSTGKVTALAVGSAKITVTTKSGSKTASCDITVGEKGSGSDIITVAVENVALDQANASLLVGDTLGLTATITPDNASNKTVNWQSSNPEIASVDENGLITALSRGQTTISVTTDDGKKKASCTVIVDVPAPVHPVQSIALDKTKITVYKGSTEQLTATIIPTNATNKKLIWESSNPSIASVDQKGKVTAKKVGTITITATSDDGGKKASCTVTVIPVPVESITFTDKNVKMYVRAMEQLRCKIEPANATNTNVTWKSSDPSIIDVDKNGMVSAYALGKVTITVTTEDGSKTDTCTVTAEERPILVKTVTLNKSEATMTSGSALKLVATINPPEAAEGRVIEWSSSASAVASVDENGNVKALSYGTATITASVDNNGIETITGTCKVIIPEPSIPPTSIRLDRNKAKIGTYDLNSSPYYLKLTAYTEPSDAKTKITWRSEDSSIISSEGSGRFKPKKEGVATVYAMTDNGLKAECEVTVTQTLVKVTGVSLNKNSETMLIGTTLPLNATVTPPNAENKKVFWLSSNPSVATVSDTGIVTAIAVGEADITVTTEDGNKADSCKIKVTSDAVKVTKVELGDKTAQLTLGGNPLIMTATVSPTNATNKNVIWESNQEAVATVDDKGIVTPVAAGKAVITATSVDNPQKSASCTVTVVTPIQDLAINQSSYEMTTSSSIQLNLTITPTNTDIKSITWISSNTSVATVTSQSKSLIGTVKSLKTEGTTRITAIVTDQSNNQLERYCDITVKIPKPNVLTSRMAITIADTDNKGTSPSSKVSIQKPATNSNIAESVSTISTPETTAPKNSGSSSTPETTAPKSSGSSSTPETTAPKSSGSSSTPKTTAPKSSGSSSTPKTITPKSSGSSSNSKTITPKSSGSSSTSKTTTPNSPVVTNKVTKMSLDKTSTAVAVGKTTKLSIKSGPTASVVWSSSDKSIVTVEQDGTIKGIKKGTALVTAVSADGKQRASCIVRVN